MSFLSFNWDKHFIYAIVYWILEICVRLSMYLRWKSYKMSSSDVQNEYIFVVLLNISDLLAVFLVLYIKWTLRKIDSTKTKEIEKKNSGVQYIYEDAEETNNLNFIKRIILISALDYLSRSLYWISYAITGANNDIVSHTLQKDIVNTLDILMRYAFSIFILKIVIHRHRVLSVILITFGFVILLPVDFIYLKSNDNVFDMSTTLKYAGILAFRAVFGPLEDTFIKKLYSENYILPEYLMLARGCFEFIIIAIITPILYFSFDVKWDIHFGYENIITLIIYTFASFVKSYFLLKIIYHFSSQSVSFLVISESVTGSINEIIDFVKDEDKQILDIILLILEMIGILIIAFATLLYDEVIIIKKWNLDKNVKPGIIKRGEADAKKISDIDINREPSFDEMASPPDNDFKEKMLEMENLQQDNDSDEESN